MPLMLSEQLAAWDREIAPIERARFCGERFEQASFSLLSSCRRCSVRESSHLKLEFMAVLALDAENRRDTA